MTRMKLTEYESRRLADAIAAECRAMGGRGRGAIPRESRSRIRAQMLRVILDEREADKKRGMAQAEGREPEDTFRWQPQRRR